MGIGMSSLDCAVLAKSTNANGGAGGFREDTASRQTVRADDGKGKWALGRTASAKIREGLGFRRSMSTQNV